MIKPSCLIKVPSSIDGGTFFHWWLRFLSPFHNLTSREMDVAAVLFQRRYELSKTVSDPVVLDSLSANADARHVAEVKLGLSEGYVNVIFNKLRKNKVIVDKRLNPKFIPDLCATDKGLSFSALLVFDFSEDGKKAKE